MFEIEPHQWEKINKWQEEQDAKWRNRKFGKPYFGAIGGSLTYSFTPTSLGTVLKVKHANGEELDVTDYKDW